MVDKIQNGVVVTMSYTLTVENEVVESAEADDPLYYLHGSDNIVPGLEAKLEGRTVGDKLTVTLQPADAYGEYDESEVQEAELADFDLPEGGLSVGDEIEIEDTEGYLLLAMVKEVNEKTVLLDYNSPMAGKVVTFDVEVLGLREATEEELMNGEPEEYAELFGDFHDHDHDDHDHDHDH